MDIDQSQKIKLEQIIQKCEIIAISKGFQLPLSFLSHKTYLEHLLQSYSECLTLFGYHMAEKKLQEILIPLLLSVENNIYKEELAMHQKDYEEKDFTNASVKSKQTTEMMDKGKLKRQKGDKIMEACRRHASKESEESLQKIDEYFGGKLRQCMLMQILMRNKLLLKLFTLNIKEIHITASIVIADIRSRPLSFLNQFITIYSQPQSPLMEYQFKFFKIYRSFQQVKALENENNESDQFGWVKKFIPKKLLKVNIDAKINIIVEEYLQTQSHINDLEFFLGYFYEISNQFTVQINLQKKGPIQKWAKSLQNLWKCLKKIKSIKLAINFIGYIVIPSQQASQYQSSLFGELACFSQITGLSIEGVGFDPKAYINTLLAIEQSLTTLFENNRVAHLKLYYCYHFPIFPKITTLKSIHLFNFSWRKKINFINSAAQTNQQLKSIKCDSIGQAFNIEERLLDRLQTLDIQRCQSFSFFNKQQLLKGPQNNYLSQQSFLKEEQGSKILCRQQPSNLKNFTLDFAIMGGRCEFLLAEIFSKLFHLNYLKLFRLHFDHQLICSIPSPHLLELEINNNNILTAEGLQKILLKWPSLHRINLQECQHIKSTNWEYNIDFEVISSEQRRLMVQENRKNHMGKIFRRFR